MVKFMKNNKIVFYKYNGEIDHEEVLNNKGLIKTNGMMIKCYLKDGTQKVGYSDPYRLHDNDYLMEVKDYIYLMTWNNLDEEKHELVGDEDSKYNKTYTPINIADIINIEAILYSNPKWGGKLTNLFSFSKSSNKEERDTENLPDWLKEILKNE